MPKKPAATTADKAVTERILWPRAAIIGIRPSRLLSEDKLPSVGSVNDGCR